MKVIDLLNKIAKGELEDLALVKFCEHDCLTIYHKADNRFEFTNKGDWEDYFYKIDIEELNYEIEIIEEDKKIKKISLDEMYLTEAQQENKKYKEVIDKIQKHCEIEINASNHYLENHSSQQELCHKVAHQRILDILKEVEE